MDAQASATPVRPAARILALDPRMEAYVQFRQLYETARYPEALPLAKRVVELSEADANSDFELPIAYNNLGATHYQLGEYAAAEGAYKKSLDVLEATQGISSRRLIVPLAGLGAVYAAQDQHAKAIEMFERAIARSTQVQECFLMTGQRDYSLRVLVDDLEDYDEFVKTVLRSVGNISSMETSFALREVKARTQVFETRTPRRARQ